MKVKDLLESSPLKHYAQRNSHKNLIRLRKDLGWLDHFSDTLDISAYKNLDSLEGCPTYIAGTFRCSETAITSLKYGPKHVGLMYAANETKITSLEGVAKHIGRTLFASWIPTLKTLHNIHKQIQHVNEIKLMNTPIQSSVLGLLLIDGLQNVDNSLVVGKSLKTSNSEWATIVNKYLPNTRGNDAVLECQNALIDAGLDEYAQL